MEKPIKSISSQAARTLRVMVMDRLSLIYKVYPHDTENRLVALNDLTHLCREMGISDRLADYE